MTAVHATLLPLLLAGAAVQELPVPPLTGPVVDRAGLLSPIEAERIAAGLRDYQARTSNQLQVLIVPSLPEAMPIEEYSIRVVEDWKLGTAEKDNGVLLLISVQDRKWRIEVGGGIEGELTDLTASRIGSETLVPALRRGEYASGIASTLERISGALGDPISFEGMPVRQVPRRQPINFVPLILFALLILFAGRRRRGGLLAGMILGHTLGRGWGGGGGGGGGGWGGGGGGFSGGGAGGDW